MIETIMKCMRCHTTMTEGRTYIQDRVPLGSRRARQNGKFVFWPEGDGDKEIVPKLANTSFYCPTCDTLVLPGVYEALTCFSCNQLIPETADACPGCGWTWK